MYIPFTGTVVHIMSLNKFHTASDERAGPRNEANIHVYLLNACIGQVCTCGSQKLKQLIIRLWSSHSWLVSCLTVHSGHKPVSWTLCTVYILPRPPLRYFIPAIFGYIQRPACAAAGTGLIPPHLPFNYWVHQASLL